MTGEQLLPQDAAESPELLVLVALDTTLWTLQIALYAAYPELIDEYAKKRDGPTARAAQLLSDRAAGLTKAIARYRKALRADRSLPPDPDNLYF
jgi:hypothetical protein